MLVSLVLVSLVLVSLVLVLVLAGWRKQWRDLPMWTGWVPITGPRWPARSPRTRSSRS